MADSDTSQALERIEKKLEEVEAAQKSKAAIGLAAPIIAVVIIVIMLYYALSPLITLYQERDQVTEEIIAQANERLLPELETEARSFLENDVVPAYKTALSEVVDARGPEIVELTNSEAQILYENLSIEIETQVTSFIQDFSEEQYEKMLEIYPELTALDDRPDPNNPELKKSQMIAAAMQTATQQLTDEMFSVHYKALEKMEREFAAIKVSKEIEDMGQEELKSYIASLALELVMYKLDADYGINTDQIYEVLEGVIGNE